MSGPWRAPSRLWIAVPAGVAAAVAVLAGLRGREDHGLSAAAATDLEPAQAVLEHCRAEGEGALDDPACRAAWASARRRFLGGAP